MNTSFSPFEFVEFVGARWRIAAGIAGCAVLVALGLSLVLPNKFTATASIVIEPPGGSDPRISTAVSPVYLESLKTYEQFASSDTLFAQACAKFGLLGGGNPPAIETLKRRVLEVRKPKETKLLQIAVTLGEPKLAQALVQFLAERTVELSNTVAGEGDAAAARRARTRLETVRAELVRREQALAATASAGRQTSLEAELVALAKLQSQISSDIADTGARIAEFSSRESAASGSPADLNLLRDEIRAQRARKSALEATYAGMTGDIAAKSAALSGIQVRSEQLQARIRTVQGDVEAASKRLAEVESTAGMRAEQLRIIDPGIVPQRPSSPNIPLNCAAALVLGTVAAMVYLAMRFGLERQRASYNRIALKVAHRESA